jgi:hypothetical protein
VSILSELAIRIPPTAGPGELLDFCVKCTRLSAIDKVAEQQQCFQKIKYKCKTCGFSCTRSFELVKYNGNCGSIYKHG